MNEFFAIDAAVELFEFYFVGFIRSSEMEVSFFSWQFQLYT